MSLPSSPHPKKRTKLFVGLAALVFVVFVSLGVMASNGWLPTTDPLTGKKTGWFGSPNCGVRNAECGFPARDDGSEPPASAGGLMPTSSTPQLSKELIYAGSRLLNIEDANANAAPPADLAVWRPSNGYFYVLGGLGSAQTYFPWGVNGDLPVPGDFDGDGKTDFSVFRPSTGVWWVTKSSDGSNFSYQFGLGTDKAAQADYDGDGRTDIAVWRPSTGVWYIVQSSSGGVQYATFGINGDTPAPADYDGDGKADIGVWRSSNQTFYSVNSGNNLLNTSTFSQSGTQPVSADYDGDGKADYAIRSGNNWVIRNSATSGNSATPPVTIPWQLATDLPVQNDYDGDGKVDIATWRDANGNWFIRQSASNNSLRQVQWGLSGDIPVPAFYRR